MVALSEITVTPQQVARAYRSVEQGATAAGGGGGGGDGPGGTPDFGAVLGQALAGAVSTGRAAEAQSMSAIAGGGDLTAAVTALSRADLALQTTVAIRDRVVQAYQDIMKMPI